MTAPTNAPEQIVVGGLDDYLAAMARVVFQSGLGRTVVDAKWDDIVAEFDQFSIETVADYGPDKVDALCDDRRVIRNRRKIEAIISNANRIVDLEDTHGFVNWIRGHDDEATRNDALRKEFKFLGEAGAHEFCWIVGEPTAEGCPPRRSR